MAANIIYMDDISKASSALFHAPTEAMRDYYASAINAYERVADSTVSENLIAVKSKFNELFSSNNLKYISNLKNRVMGVWNPNEIGYLSDINSIQQAPDVMKRWVMTHPYIRERHLNDGITAYGHSYKEIHQMGVSNEHYDYRRVMDGVIHTSDDGETSYSVFYENVEEVDILSIANKCSIIGTWGVIDKHIESGDNADLTDQWGGTW